MKEPTPLPTPRRGEGGGPNPKGQGGIGDRRDTVRCAPLTTTNTVKAHPIQYQTPYGIKVGPHRAKPNLPQRPPYLTGREGAATEELATCLPGSPESAPRTAPTPLAAMPLKGGCGPAWAVGITRGGWSPPSCFFFIQCVLTGMHSGTLKLAACTY